MSRHKLSQYGILYSGACSHILWESIKPISMLQAQIRETRKTYRDFVDGIFIVFFTFKMVPTQNDALMIMLIMMQRSSEINTK